MSDTPKTRCFVIMPFSKTDSHPEAYWTSHFEKFLKPLIEEVENVEASRSQAARGGITPEIIMNLIESDLVVADITDYNPNVLWELGVRHSFKPGTITIAEEGTQIPFDIKDKGVLFYDTGHLNKEFKDSLIKAVQDCCENPDESDSPILEAISGRGTLYGLIQKKTILKKITGLIWELHTNELAMKTLLDAIKKGDKLDEIFTFEFTTASMDHFFTERYLEKHELNPEDYSFHGENFADSIGVFFVLWTIHRRLGEVKHYVNHPDRYRREHIIKRFEMFYKDVLQIQKDLKEFHDVIKAKI